MNWTGPQEEAIRDRGGHVLCSAAAGSGKTAVLAARVVGRLTDPVSPVGIDRLLVVTFTRAAAAEMRRRVAALLRAAAASAPWLDDQLWLLPRADITTVHGFCERTVRRHFLEVGADPSFTVLDEAEGRVLLAEALDRVLEARYAGRGMDAAAAAAFVDMVERYGGRRLDASLRALVLELRSYAQSMPDPEAWLAGAVRSDIGWDAAREAVRRKLAGCRARTERAVACAPEAYRPALEADHALFARLLTAVAGPWDALAEMLRSASLVRLAAIGEGDRAAAERVRDLRQANRDALAELAAGPFGRPEAEHVAEAAEVAAHLRPLVELALDLEHTYAAEKARTGALDFDDLEHRCLDVLRGAGGEAVAARYAEVLVDESQDLSPVQDELLSLLVDRGAALFAVGDARQSIYGFRQAEPRRFALRERRYAAGGGRIIELPHNFRSRRPVVAAVNFVFGRLFRTASAALPASALRPMEAAADYPPVSGRALGTSAAPPASAGAGNPVRIVLLEGDVDEDSTSLEREAAEVCLQVREWLAGALVHDPDATSPGAPYRPARPGDVAVLLRAPGGTAHAYVEALRSAGIPCWSPDQGHRASTLEGRTLVAWWRTLENPQQDIPLAATLLSAFGGFSPAELAEVRLAAPAAPLWHAVRACAAGAEGALAPRAAAFMARLERWRTEARRGQWAELLARALDETGYAAQAGGLPGGAERRRNLEWCLERCREADRFRHWGLARLIAHLENGGGDTVAEAAMGAGDAVRVLSIHGSKGLEFPLVVVAGLGRRFHGREGSADVLAQRDLGVGARRVDLDRRLRWPTLAHAVVAARREEQARAEELRILYVAMTRARETLTLVGTLRNLAERVGGAATLAEALSGTAAGTAPTLELEEGACYADWLLPVLAEHADVAAAFGTHAGIPFRGTVDGEGSRWEVVLRLGPVAGALAADGAGDGAEAGVGSQHTACPPPAAPATPGEGPSHRRQPPLGDAEPAPGGAPATPVGPSDGTARPGRGATLGAMEAAGAEVGAGAGDGVPPPAVAPAMHGDTPSRPGRPPLGDAEVAAAGPPATPPAPSAESAPPGRAATTGALLATDGAEDGASLPPAVTAPRGGAPLGVRRQAPDDAGGVAASHAPRPLAISGGIPAAPDPGGSGDNVQAPGVWARLEAEHAWRYGWQAATRLAAKVEVGQWRERLATRAGIGEETGGDWQPGAGPRTRPAAQPPPGLARPRWLEAGTQVPPAEVGTATHALLRHVDLGGPCDRPALEACRADLVARGLLAAPAAALVDLQAVARFLAGPLGRRLRARPRAVRREVPFALRLAATEVYPEEPAAGEWVLVQGIIDALALEEGGLLLVDYKTDAAGAADAERYRPQVALYARAAASAWSRPVRAAWLCFLASGEDVPINTG